ncbi:MAG: DUF4339 domain-containing protein [Verrucomicrobia bacterium]|nr:DUF4339 domain-containing protein [Verrucomicrobiota bacterium]
MDGQWYYRDGTERRGPFDTNTMRQLWDAGAIGPDTPVSCGETGAWQPVSSLKVSWLGSSSDGSGNVSANPHVDISANKPAGAWKLLALSFLPLAAYHAALLLGKGSLFTLLAQGVPDRPFNWIGMATRMLPVFGWCALLACVIALLRFAGGRQRGAGKKAVISIVAALTWILVVLTCIWIPVAENQIAMHGMVWKGGEGGMVVMILLLGFVAAIGWFAVWLASIVSRRAQAGATGVSSLVAGYALSMAISLAVSTIAITVIWVSICPSNPERVSDVRTADEILRGLDACLRTEGVVIPGETTFVVDAGMIEEFNRRMPGGSRLKGDPSDAYGQPFVIRTCDSRGMVKLGSRSYRARAVVCSLGRNMEDDQGDGDDLLRFLK